MSPPGTRQQPRRIRKQLLWLVGAAITASLLWFWPARRNYYFKRDEVRYRLDIPYAAGSTDPKQELDLYLPVAAARGFPIVVFVHGGYWSALDRRWLEPLLGTHGNVGVAFARHGVAAAIVGYRQYPNIQSGDDSLDDIATAVRFVHASCPSWGCGPLFLVGHSAGGHLVSLLGMDPRILLRNGVDPAAIAGFVSMDGIFDLKASLSSFTPEQSATMRKLFGPSDATLAVHSSISYARRDHPRLLFLDSTNDEKVCRGAFREMRARMAAVGSSAQFVELPGLGHNETVVRVGMDDDPVMPSLLAFIGQ